MSTVRAAISTRQQNVTTWTNSQAYVLAAFCLMLGVTLGYLFRGSASQDVPASARKLLLPVLLKEWDRGRSRPSSRKPWSIAQPLRCCKPCRTIPTILRAS